jgi:hypothetical protein
MMSKSTQTVYGLKILKVVADLVAHLDVDKLKADGNIGRFSLEYDIGKEIEILWQELQGTRACPKLPPGSLSQKYSVYREIRNKRQFLLRSQAGIKLSSRILPML